MKDRIPVNPGRVLINPEDGSAPFYATMTRADNPTQNGDPLNKATLLKDATAALYGLDETAVPDDAFAWLGKYNQHWWKLNTVNTFQEISIGETKYRSVIVQSNSLSKQSFQTSNSVEIDESGNIILSAPISTVKLSYSDSSDTVNAALNGKYFISTNVGTSNFSTNPIENNKVYFAESLDAKDTSSGYCTNGYVSEVSIVTKTSVSLYGYAQSSDRNAYPDSGITDNFEYEYLGIPFDNAVNASRIETGSYVGTGTYGSSNPNTLTFGFAPKLVFILGVSESATYISSAIMPAVCPKFLVNAKANNIVSLSDKTMTWYTEYSSLQALYQLNDRGTIYHYIAIG